MAEQTWSGISLHQEAFNANKARASAAAADLKAAFVSSMAGEIAAQQQQNTQVDANTEGAFEQARGLLRSPRQKAIDAAAARAERLQKRHEEHEREQAKEPTAAGVVGLSEAQFRTSAERAFSAPPWMLAL